MKSEVFAKAVIVLWGAALLVALGVLYSQNPELTADLETAANAIVASR
jgi:hypothetical protein